MNLDGKFHPINVGFRLRGDVPDVHHLNLILGGFEYSIYRSNYTYNFRSNYIYKDKRGFKYTLSINLVGDEHHFNVYFDLFKSNRDFYESVLKCKESREYFIPFIEYIRSQYRKAMIDEVLEIL